MYSLYTASEQKTHYYYYYYYYYRYNPVIAIRVHIMAQMAMEWSYRELQGRCSPTLKCVTARWYLTNLLNYHWLIHISSSLLWWLTKPRKPRLLGNEEKGPETHFLILLKESSSKGGGRTQNRHFPLCDDIY